MKTSLKDYLERRDMHLRRSQIDIPEFCAGSLMAVTRVDPHSKSGESRFVGICIARRNKRLGSTFVLRNVIGGEGVERTFELYSPMIKKIEILKLQRRRRAKLYYLRDKPLKESVVSEQMKAIPVKDPNVLPPRYRKRGK
jgi:large subunit ribosomal protein L19